MPGWTADFASLSRDRTAIEEVYYRHRLESSPSAKRLSQKTLDHLARLDVRKEALLKKVYGVEITPEMVTAEVKRINTTTQAPERLAEIKAALGNDAGRFAQSVARPVLVERELRQRFDNDEKLHGPLRQGMTGVREQVLAARSTGVEEQLNLLKHGHASQVSEMTWQLVALSEEKRGTNLAVLYFDDLPEDLRKVLTVQLQKPGDVSAVIETPGVFLLYVAKVKTAETLSAAVWSLPKRNYERWIQEAGTE